MYFDEDDERQDIGVEIIPRGRENEPRPIISSFVSKAQAKSWQKSDEKEIFDENDDELYDDEDELDMLEEEFL